jgi:amidase
MTDLAFRPAVELARMIRDREIGSVELLEHFIARVERFDGAINAVVVRDFERARARAREADAALKRGKSWGVLHGVPMTLKESFDIAGLKSTWGLPAAKDNVAKANALAVDRFLGAGAVIFGKTNVPLLLGDFQSYNEIYGTTNNPWDRARIPGGSSGGSAAALAAGMTALEAGSDIGGSIRNPAHFSGVYGLKPSWGIAPPRGHSLIGALGPSDISVIGPLARSPEDLALALDVMGGPDALQASGWRLDLPRPAPKSLRDFRVGVWLDHPRFPIDGEVAERLEAAVAAVKRAGAAVDERARPEIDAERAYQVYLQLLFAVMMARRPREEYASAVAEAASLAPDDRSYRAERLRGAALAHRDWLALNEERTKLRWRWHELFERFDVLLCPIAPTVAYKHDQSPDQEERRVTINGRQVEYLDQLFWAGITCVAYLPATIAPVGPSRSGLPVGLQIVGPELGDRATIEFARLLAQEIGGFKAPPGY